MSERTIQLFPTSDYNKFRSGPDVLNVTWQHITSKTKEELKWSHKIEPLFELLAKKGFHRFGAIYPGGHAIVLEGPHHQMLRIASEKLAYGRSKDEYERPQKPYYVQPLATIDDFAGYRIEVLPRFHRVADLCSDFAIAEQYGFKRGPQEGDHEYAARIRDTLEHRTNILKAYIETVDNGVPKDFIDTNIAVIPTEQGYVLKALDPGVARYPDDDEKAVPHPLKPLEEIWVRAEGNYIKTLGLKRGKISYVVGEDEIEALRKRGYDPNDTVYSRIQDQKLYVDEALKMIGNAIKEISDEEANRIIHEQGFCGFAKQAMDRKLDASTPCKSK